jgi:hypothetical protein
VLYGGTKMQKQYYRKESSGRPPGKTGWSLENLEINNLIQMTSKKRLDKIDDVCIIDSVCERRLFGYDHEEDELLFGGFADKEAEGDQQKNWTSTLRHFKACH